MGTYIAIAAIAGIVNLIAFIWLVVAGFQRSVLWGILVFLFSPFAAIIFAVMYWMDAKKPFLLYMVSSVAIIGAVVMMFTEIDTAKLARVMEGIESGEIKPNEAFEQYAKPDEITQSMPSPGMGMEGDGISTDSAGLPIDAPTETPITSTQTAEAGAVTTSESSSVKDAVVEKAPAEQVEPTPAGAAFPSPGMVKPDPLVTKKKKSESPTISVKPDNLASYKGRYFIITTKDGNQHRGLLNKVNDTTLFLSRKLYGGNFEYRVARKKVTRADMLKEEFVKDFMER